MCCFMVLCHAVLYRVSCGLLSIQLSVHILEAHLSLLFKPLCHLVCVVESQELSAPGRWFFSLYIWTPVYLVFALIFKLNQFSM